MGVLYLLSEGSSVKKSGPRIVVEKNSEIVGRLPIRTIDAVVVGQNSQITTQVIFELIEQRIPVCYVDNFGKVVGCICNEKQSSSRLLRQLEIFRDTDKQIIFSREIISEKISNQCSLLKRYSKTSENEKIEKITKELMQTAKTLSDIKSIEEIRGVEGIAAKNYFSAFPVLIDQTRWKWKGRSQHPAKDPINSLLNYGYAFLEREVRISVAVFGMDARIGFFHSNDGRKDSLVFDLMEFFRQPVIDRFILSLLNRRMIQPEHFQTTPEDCRLTIEGRRVFCTRYEEYMAKKYKEYDEKNTREFINERVKKFSAYLNR